MEEMNKEHELKVVSELWYVVAYGIKTFEYRKNDRDFKVGDILILRNYDTIKGEYVQKTEHNTCNAIRKEISYILYGGAFGIPIDYCIMVINEPHLLNVPIPPPPTDKPLTN